jgi:hypothetical protein
VRKKFYRRERPARAALALILDASDGALRSPVDARRQRIDVDVLQLLRHVDLLVRVVNVLHAVVDASKLLRAQVTKLVHAYGVRVLLVGIVLLDEIDVLLELRYYERRFFSREVFFC